MKPTAVIFLTLGLTCAALAKAQDAPHVSAIFEHAPPPTVAVENEPYSATEISTNVRTLADGTKITTTRKTCNFRDGQGRVRSDNYFSNDGQERLEFTVIIDPVAHTSTRLDPYDKTARVSEISVMKPFSPELLERMKAARENAAKVQPPPTVAKNKNITTEHLPSREIQGVTVEGRRTTIVRPAGRMGNDRDLTTTLETWYSPELRLNMESTSNSPTDGVSKTEMTEFSRREPDRTVFDVPQGYKVVQEPVRTSTAQ